MNEKLKKTELKDLYNAEYAVKYRRLPANRIGRLFQNVLRLEPGASLKLLRSVDFKSVVMQQ